MTKSGNSFKSYDDGDIALWREISGPSFREIQAGDTS
jgi:hypothetical protein